MRFTFLLAPILSIYLIANRSDLLEFTCIANSDLSIELKEDTNDPTSTSFLMHEFDNRDIKQNSRRKTKIGTMYLIISNPVPERVVERVYIWGSSTSQRDEFELIDPYNQPMTLVIETDKNSSGKKKKTTLKSGNVVREFLPGQSIAKPENYKISFFAKRGVLGSLSSGAYEAQIYFVVISE